MRPHLKLYDEHLALIKQQLNKIKTAYSAEVASEMVNEIESHLQRIREDIQENARSKDFYDEY